MAVELGGVRLHRIHRISVLEQAGLVYHRVPGLEGSAVQDLGRDSVRLAIDGIVYGPDARGDLEALRQIHQARRPVDFLAEITGEAYFASVVIDRLEVWQASGEPEQLSYRLTVAEHVAAAEPPIGRSAVDDGIAEEAAIFMEAATLPEVLKLGSIPEVTDPLEPLSGTLEPVSRILDRLDDATAGLQVLLGVTDGEGA